VVGWVIWVCSVGSIIVGFVSVVWCMEVISVYCLCGAVGNLIVYFARWVTNFFASSSSIYRISIASSLSDVL
jgi:hypothetical protein